MTSIVDDVGVVDTQSQAGAARYLVRAGAPRDDDLGMSFVMSMASNDARYANPVRMRANGETVGFAGRRRTPGLERVQRRIQEFISAGEGWGFGQEKAVTMKAGYRAIDVARRLSKRLGGMPKTFATSDGEILLSWSADGKDVEVYVPERGPMSALVETHADSVEFTAADAIAIEARIPR